MTAGTRFSFDIPGPLLAYVHGMARYLTTGDLFGSPGPGPEMTVSEGNDVAQTGPGPVSG